MKKRVVLFTVLLFSLLLLVIVWNSTQSDGEINRKSNLDENISQEDQVPYKEENSAEKEKLHTEETIQAENELQTEDTLQIEDASQLETEHPVSVEDSTFVRVKTYIPDIKIELKYAGTDNFTGQKIYDFTDAYLRYGTVKKLQQVQESLREEGLSLKIWDAFRPTSAQFTLWEVYPDATYVANPNNGFSSHSRGNTVDITLVNQNGEELIMPTKFDDFSNLADRDYSDCSEEARKNALLLENLMKENGFKAYSGEWWHFTDVDTYYVEEIFQP